VETGHACFSGLTLADTVKQCIRLGNAHAATRLRQEFRLSDRRFWWIKVTLKP
jgi:vacuolar protein sorting-associated protein 16